MAGSVLQRWQREWTLQATTAAIGPRWEGEAALADAADLDGVLARVRLRPDETLAALLRLGQAGDELALRTVVQAMLPVARRVAQGRPGVLDDLIGELWLAAADYPLARQPRAIAANLAWRVRRRGWTAGAEAGPGVELSELPATLGTLPLPEPIPEPDAARTLATAHRLGLITAEAHLVLWTVYVAGRNSKQAAAELGTSPELVRYRCSRELRRLREHAELLAA